MPQPLRLDDVRTAFRLIGDIRAAGGDPAAWRTRLVRGLQKLLHAELVVSSEVHVRKLPGRPTSEAVRVIDVGWGCDANGETWQIHTDQEARPQEFMLSVLPDGQAPADADVPVAPTTRLRGGSSFVMSQYPLPHLGAVDQLGVHKDVTAAAFSPAQHRLIRLFHVELGRLWKRDAMRRVRDPDSELPPRLAQTLQALQAGCSEKEVGTRLGISRHTVHNYVKALHARFGVSSRGELLAKVKPADTGFLPQFSVKR